jgi:hypothetical protein
MDRIARYQSALRELVQEYAADWKPRDGTCIEAVTDAEHGHYQIIRTGWQERRFVHSCLVHFAVRGGEIHLLKNDTEVEWERKLAERGVTPEHFVLAFRQPVDRAKAAATA